jgi:hypothetical protein
MLTERLTKIGRTTREGTVFHPMPRAQKRFALTLVTKRGRLRRPHGKMPSIDTADLAIWFVAASQRMERIGCTKRFGRVRMPLSSSFNGGTFGLTDSAARNSALDCEDISDEFIE